MSHTLEEAIKLAQMKMATDSKYIGAVVIESKFASRKRNRLATVSLGDKKRKKLTVVPSPSDDDDSDDATFWKGRCAEMQKEDSKRINTLEQCLEKYSRLESYSKLLKQQIDEHE